MTTSSLRRSAALILTLLVVPLVPGCNSKSPTAPTLPDGDVFPVGLFIATTSGLVESERRLVRDQAAYETLQEDILGDNPDEVVLDDVDFDQNMVLAVASGEQPEACYAIEVTAGQADGTDLTVTVTETGPTTDCICAAMMSQPVHVVQVPRADEVSFFTVSATACEE